MRSGDLSAERDARLITERKRKVRSKKKIVSVLLVREAIAKVSLQPETPVYVTEPKLKLEYDPSNKDFVPYLLSEIILPTSEFNRWKEDLTNCDFLEHDLFLAKPCSSDFWVIRDDRQLRDEQSHLPKRLTGINNISECSARLSWPEVLKRIRQFYIY